MNMKHDHNVIYLEEEMQYVRSETGHWSARLPLYAHNATLVLWFWWFCSFFPFPVLVLVL
jgi:hypothetical protein